MKKYLIIMCAATCIITSCSSVRKSATSRTINAPVAAAVIADLDVSNQKITYTYSPTKNVRRVGLQNCINHAISAALEANGGGDILLETQPAVYIRGSKIHTITITGYPAKYKNFRPADEETIKAAIVSGSLSTQNPSNLPTTEKKKGIIVHR